MESAMIRELATAERPREKLVELGAKSLTDAELLAIFIRSGTKGRSAVAVARDLLKARGSLQGVSRCSVDELRQSAKGIGKAKAVGLAAAFEVGKRLARGSEARPMMNEPEAIYELLGPELQAMGREVLNVLLLDVRYRLIRTEEVSIGSLSESIAHPREVFRPAIVHSAHGIVVTHNHPSGDPSPSEADRKITVRLAEAGRLLQIQLVDHVIIGSPEGERLPYFSFREHGLL
jgi:DNA repair protein RadC